MTTIGVPGMTAWVYDSSRDLVYMASSNGLLYSYSLGEQKFTQTLAIYGSPGSMDISADGAFLLVGNSQKLLTSGPFDFQKTYADVLTKVDLSTGAHAYFQFTPTGGEGAIGEVAISQTGAGLLTTFYEGSGWTPFRQFDAAAGGFATIGVGFGGLSASSGSSSALLPSEDRRYILIQEVNSSSGPLRIYDSATGTITASTDLYRVGYSGYQNGRGDISTAAGKVVDVLYNNVFIFDLGLNPVANLSVYTSTGRVVGGEFNDGGHQLFLWQGADRKVLVLDAQTWAEVGTLDVSAATGAGYSGAAYGLMDVASNGRVLILDTGNGLELIDLSVNLKITINGSAANESLHGAVGRDSLAGQAGADTVSGYAGDDLISGGPDGDLLDGGAGVDTVTYADATTAMNVDLGSGRGGASGEDTLSGFERVTGGGFGDTLAGSAGADTLSGGGGADLLLGREGVSVLRGDEGNDQLIGGAAFDDLNGNAGDDTASGGDGGDWVVGGKDNDLLSGDAGDDIVYGNLGNDRGYGGDGNDLVRGGQGDDVVDGGAGNDWLSGDLGADNITGGTGADIFHTFATAGLDLVTDFSLAQGDRVQLDPGTTYTLRQDGANTIIDMGGGNQMILVGVQMSTLTSGWIFGA